MAHVRGVRIEVTARGNCMVGRERRKVQGSRMKPDFDPNLERREFRPRGFNFRANTLLP